MKHRSATLTFASFKQAAKAISELNGSIIDGQTRYLEVQADKFFENNKKGKKKTGSGLGDPTCKTCEQGECPNHKGGAQPQMANTGGAGKVKLGDPTCKTC